jgi:hypothetical protein
MPGCWLANREVETADKSRRTQISNHSTSIRQLNLTAEITKRTGLKTRHGNVGQGNKNQRLEIIPPANIPLPIPGYGSPSLPS